VDFTPVNAIAAEIPVESALMPGSLAQVKSKSRALTATLNASKDEIRTSLKASTLDGVFASLFSNVTGGLLLTNFLLQLGANSTEIGLVASIPMLANLMQPLGAYISERTTSRHYYCLWTYGISRSLWLGLAIAIFWVGSSHAAPGILIALTLGIAVLSYFLGALGSAPWLSWMAALVPRPLRGRYFGLRNSAANLTNLLSVPLMGVLISEWRGGSTQGYGLVLMLGIVSGLVSLWFQNFMVDVNPQTGQRPISSAIEADLIMIPSTSSSLLPPVPTPRFWQDLNFLKFLLYFNLWTFAVSLSAPFFNVYLLNNLDLGISQVTLYNSLTAGANLLLLMFWGKLADRIGNRPILVGVGIVFSVLPLLWLTIDTNSLSIWVWLPLLHLMAGGTMAAIDLCSSNLQLGIAPSHHQSTYFGMAAASAGISGAIGTTAGGFFAQFGSGGLLGLFALSSVLRLAALLSLIFVQERQIRSL
jgi:MFS family permease